MNYTNSGVLTHEHIAITNHLPNIGMGTVKEEILNGFRASPKYIPSKFFYDKHGSELFEKITRLDEYYPTRTEKSILSSIGKNLYIDWEGAGIVELGSGDHSKIRLLLSQIPPEALSTLSYFPVDISQSAILNASEKLLEEFPSLHIEGIVADFVNQLQLIPNTGNRVFCFFGSTIGNFDEAQAKRFLKNLGRQMQPGDHLLLGLDMVKDTDILEKAYNDAQGITAAFNKNILNVVNKLAGTDFRPELFEHVAFYNEERCRIEMHLRALQDMAVQIHPENGQIFIDRGERIHTENSHKFNEDHIRKIGLWAGMKTEQIFTDENRWFSLVHYVK